MTECIILARHSPRPDGDTSESCDIQLRDLREAAKQRQWKVIAEFADRNVSGDDFERPELWSAMAMLTKGQVLFVWDAKRLTRDLYLGEKLHFEAKRKKARIVYLHGQNNDSIEGEMLRQMLAVVANYEKKSKSATTSAMMRSRQKAGEWMGSRPPIGTRLKRIGTRTKRFSGKEVPHYILEPCPEELAFIRVVKALRAMLVKTGDYTGSHYMAKVLNDYGHTFRGHPVRRKNVDAALAFTGDCEPPPIEGLGEVVLKGIPEWDEYQGSQTIGGPPTGFVGGSSRGVQK